MLNYQKLYLNKIKTLMLMSLLISAVVIFANAANAVGNRHLILQKNSAAEPKHVKMKLGDSFIVHLPKNAREVLISDPEKVSVIMRSARLAYMVPKKMGTTDVLFFSQDGNQIASLVADVSIDIQKVQKTINKFIDKGDVNITLIKDRVLLSGEVSNAQVAKNVVKIASSLVDDESNVINAITIREKTQVLLKVTIAEIQRNVVRKLGIDISSSLNIGSRVFNLNSTNALADAAGIGVNGSLGLGKGSSVSGNLRLLEANNLSRILAEPNLTAASGQSAEFLAGGEYPIPVSIDGEISVSYKSYGVQLSFLPIVMSRGRINLKVHTEVSSLSSLGSVKVGASEVPSLISRKAVTTVEMSSGSSLVIAGLISDTTAQSLKGVPGIKDAPVIGALFSSRQFERSQTELVVIVTPYIVKPVAPDALTRPDQGYKAPTAAETFLLGIISNVYGGSKKVRNANFNGDYGFID